MGPGRYSPGMPLNALYVDAMPSSMGQDETYSAYRDGLHNETVNRLRNSVTTMIPGAIGGIMGASPHMRGLGRVAAGVGGAASGGALGFVWPFGVSPHDGPSQYDLMQMYQQSAGIPMPPRGR